MPSIPSPHHLYTQFQDARCSVPASAGPRGWCPVREALQEEETSRHSETADSRQDPGLRDREQDKIQQKDWIFYFPEE